MKINYCQRWALLLGMIISMSASATTPASKEYLDKKMAILQAEIDAISARVHGT